MWGLYQTRDVPKQVFIQLLLNTDDYCFYLMPMCFCPTYSACDIVCIFPVDPPEKLQQTCPTCPLLLPVDSHQAVDAAQVTLASYKRQSMLSAGLGVKKITRAAAQVPHSY